MIHNIKGKWVKECDVCFYREELVNGEEYGLDIMSDNNWRSLWIWDDKVRHFCGKSCSDQYYEEHV